MPDIVLDYAGASGKLTLSAQDSTSGLLALGIHDLSGILSLGVYDPSGTTTLGSGDDYSGYLQLTSTAQLTNIWDISDASGWVALTGSAAWVDYIYVVDSGNHRVQAFEPDGTFVFEWGSYGGGAGEFVNPWGIADDGDKLYVTDSGNDRVQVFDYYGNYINEFGNVITTTTYYLLTDGYTGEQTLINEDEFKNPQVTRTVYTSGGTYTYQEPIYRGIYEWLAYNYNYNYATDAVYRYEVDKADMVLDGPKGVAATSNLSFSNLIFVVDAKNHQLRVVAKDFTSWVTVGGPEPGNGSYEFNSPTDCWISGDSLYVEDTGNSRVQQYPLSWFSYWFTTWNNDLSLELSLEATAECRSGIFDRTLIEFEMDADVLSGTSSSFDSEVILLEIEAAVGAAANMSLLDLEVEGSIQQGQHVTGSSLEIEFEVAGSTSIASLEAAQVVELELEGTVLNGFSTTENISIEIGLEGSISQDTLLSASLDIVTLEVDGSLSKESTTLGDLSAIELAVDGLMLTGADSSLSALAIELAVEGSLIKDTISNADLNVEFELLGFITDQGLQTSYAVPVLNKENMAISEYENFPFNSFARIGDTYFAAGDNGLYTLGGNSDNGSNIDLEVEVDQFYTNRGTEASPASVKRLFELWLTGSSNYNIDVVITDMEGNQYAYEAEYLHGTILRERRVKLGRGHKAEYATLTLKNQQGADVAIDRLRLMVAPIRHLRR